MRPTYDDSSPLFLRKITRRKGTRPPGSLSVVEQRGEPPDAFVGAQPHRSVRWPSCGQAVDFERQGEGSPSVSGMWITERLRSVIAWVIARVRRSNHLERGRMLQNFVLVRTSRLRDLLRLARDLALQLDMSIESKDEALVEVQLLHSVEALENELPDDVRSGYEAESTKSLSAPEQVQGTRKQ